MRFENLETLEVSKKPIKIGKRDWIFLHPSQLKNYDLSLYKNIPTFLSDKNIIHNQDYQISNIDKIDFNNKEIYFSTNIGEVFKVSLSKETEYYETFGMSENDFWNWITSNEGKKYFSLENTIPQFLTVELSGETFTGSLSKYLIKNLKKELFEEIKNPKSAYTAKIYERNEGGFFCKISNSIEGYIPGSLVAANRITDFDSYIGKSVIVMVEDYIQSSGLFILSNKKYINWIWPSAIKKLDRSKTYDGKITGTSKHGIFVEFDEIFTGLIIEEEMNSTILSMYKSKELKAGDSISVFIKSIDKQKKINLSCFSKVERDISRKDEVNEDIIEQNIEGRVFTCEIMQIKPFGALVKLENIEQWGLLPIKEINKNRLKLNPKDKIWLTVESVNLDKGKIIMKTMS